MAPVYTEKALDFVFTPTGNDGIVVSVYCYGLVLNVVEYEGRREVIVSAKTVSKTIKN